MWCTSHSAVARYELFSVDILITVVKFPNMSLFLMNYSELFFVSTNFLLHSRHFPHWIHLPYSANQSDYLSIYLSGICNRFYSLNNCKSGQPKTVFSTKTFVVIMVVIVIFGMNSHGLITQGLNLRFVQLNF